jgi:hypothetical protein
MEVMLFMPTMDEILESMGRAEKLMMVEKFIEVFFQHYRLLQQR